MPRKNDGQASLPLDSPQLLYSLAIIQATSMAFAKLEKGQTNTSGS
jgi:hypothetical protein